ncbi:MAG TPA: putative entry exclusion protein TrbK-alt [Stellaceae bacterium]|nr:putative entry exclusion protein TrbK-alt [Stellaceae bacterium]
MRVDAALLKRIMRAGAFVLLGVAILTTAMSVNTRRKETTPPAAPTRATDPLDAELARCRAIVRPEDVDDACRAAWAERRRRFFAPYAMHEVRP